MEYLVKDEPSILIDKQTGKGYPFSAEEEVFVIRASIGTQLRTYRMTCLKQSGLKQCMKNLLHKQENIG